METEASKAFRTALGFYPTSKDAEEMSIFTSVYERSKLFAYTRGLHAGNARSCYHDMAQFSFDESHALFEYAKTYPQFFSLLPTIQACQSFILSVLLASIAEDDAKIQRIKRSQKRIL
jgi:hypothetical protein